MQSIYHSNSPPYRVGLLGDSLGISFRRPVRMFRKTLVAFAMISVAASAQSAVVINEGFDNIFGLAAKG